MTGKDNKRSKTSTFKEFGNFLALNLMRHLLKRPTSSSSSAKSSKNKDASSSDLDAIEAGFAANLYKNNSNGVNKGGKKFIVDSVSGRLASSITALHGVDFTKLAEMPGVVGLSNHGNTCFINSVIQCLSNTELIAEYFLLGQYKNDMKHSRKDRSKKYGTRGEVTEQVAVIIKSLWTNSYDKNMTNQLKLLLAKHASQYKGSNQHDSQEFLLWLFDKMHEDINVTPAKRHPLLRRQSLKKIKTSKASVTAMLENGYSSFIEKFFRGFYKSCLSCPSCKMSSETTDPFLSISVPLKQRTTRPIYVNVAYLASKRRSSTSAHRNLFGKTLMIGLELPLDGSVENLRQAVAEKCSIHSRLIAFVDLHYDGFHQSYGDGDPLSRITFPNAASSNNSSSSSSTSTTCNSNNSTPTTSNMTLYAFEMPKLHLTSGTLPKNFSSKHRKQRSSEFGTTNILASEAAESEQRSAKSSNTLVVILINKQGVGREGMRFGRPVVFRTSRDLGHSELQKIILNYVQPFIKEGVTPDKLEDQFCLHVMDGLPNKSYLSFHAAKPFKLPTVDHALERCPAGSPAHIKLVAEWKPGLGIFDKVPEEKIDVDDSVRLQKVLFHQPLSCTLDECLDLLTQDEKLSADNAWRCPHCFKQQHNAVKKMSMYSLPDVMVIHLKRFKIENNQRTKLNTGVHFPLTGLDMYKRLYKPNNNLLPNRNSQQDIEEEMKMHENHIYDLYGVVHHYGSLNSGHYDAACCNTLDGRWYLYDDQRAESIMDTQLSKTNAYILFYQRRTASPALSCASEQVNTTSPHWAYHLPQLKQKFSASHGHINLNNAASATTPQPAASSPKALTNSANNNNNNSTRTTTRSNVEKINHAQQQAQKQPKSTTTLHRDTCRSKHHRQQPPPCATRGEADGIEALDEKTPAATVVVTTTTANDDVTKIKSPESSSSTKKSSSSRKKVNHHHHSNTCHRHQRHRATTSSACDHRRSQSRHRERPYSSTLYNRHQVNNGDHCDDERDDDDDDDDDGGFDSVRRPYVRGLSRPAYHTMSPHTRSSSRTLGDGSHQHTCGNNGRGSSNGGSSSKLKEERERARHYRSYRQSKNQRHSSQV